MPRRTARSLAALIVIWVTAVVTAVDAHAEIEFAAWELSGRVSLEGRYFPKTGIDPSHQSSQTTGIVVEPKLYVEEDGGSSFTLVPFFRYDSADSVRTHWDLREAYALLFGEIGAGEWEVRLGADRVFWGVAESQHLVDIVNQIDFLEHPNGEVKYGQPMVHVTWTGDWGALEFFGLPYHRQRIYPGQGGRLRFAGLVDQRAGGVREFGARGVASGFRGPLQSQLRTPGYRPERVQWHKPGSEPGLYAACLSAADRASVIPPMSGFRTTRRSASSGWMRN